MKLAIGVFVICFCQVKHEAPLGLFWRMLPKGFGSKTESAQNIDLTVLEHLLLLFTYLESVHFTVSTVVQHTQKPLMGL